LVYTWLKNAQYLLLPGTCLLCRAPSRRQSDLCAPCEDALCVDWHSCRHCGLPSPVAVSYCGRCSARPHAFDRCVALGPYQPPLSTLINRYKHHRGLAEGRVLAELLAGRIPTLYQGDALPRQLVPVPLHWRRQWLRGFNQADLLARRLGSRLQIATDGHCLQRARATPRQQGLGRRRRQANLRGAFLLRAPPGASHVALVDDVVTTGATADALAGLLLAAGCQRVDVWCLARTPRP
jgi:ComF family protein